MPSDEMELDLPASFVSPTGAPPPHRSTNPPALCDAMRTRAAADHFNRSLSFPSCPPRYAFEFGITVSQVLGLCPYGAASTSWRPALFVVWPPPRAARRRHRIPPTCTSAQSHAPRLSRATAAALALHTGLATFTLTPVAMSSISGPERAT